MNKEVKEQVKEQPKRQVKKQLDNNLLVTVKNNTDGVLIYKSPKTQMMWIFEKHGDEDSMELHELRTLASSSRRFIEENWMTIEDEEVVEYLRLNRYYEKNLSEEELDGLFELPVSEIEDVLDKSSTNVKGLILAKARQKFVNSELVNIHVIQLLEDKFNTKIDIS